MKKILIVFLALSLLIGCTPANKPDPQPGPVPVNPTPEPTPDPTPTPDPQPEPSGGEIKIPDDLTYADITLPYTFKFSKEIEGYAFNGIKLVFAGKQETPDFAANEKTIVYSRILINGKDTEVFSNMPLPVNDKVGTMTLTQLNDNYVLSFNSGAQINGQYVTCFNMDGEKIEDFSDVSITAADGLLTVEKDQQFAIDYIRTYLSKEDTLLLIKNKDYKQNLEQVRSDARDIGAFLTEFCIFSYLMGDYDSYWDEFEYSGIKYGFIFIDNLYPQYLVKEAEGGNFLCLVPTSTTATMEINSYATGKKENLFTTDCGQPVLLETQLMTGAATVEVVIMDNGKTYTFTPFYTEEDYKVDGDIVHVIDEDHLPQHYFHDYYQLIIDNTAESEDSDWAELNFNWVEDIGENMCLPARVYSADENGKTIVKYYKVGVDLDCLFVFNPDTSEYDRYY